jgi:hypothetical protein
MSLEGIQQLLRSFSALPTVVLTEQGCLPLSNRGSWSMSIEIEYKWEKIDHGGKVLRYSGQGHTRRKRLSSGEAVFLHADKIRASRAPAECNMQTSSVYLVPPVLIRGKPRGFNKHHGSATKERYSEVNDVNAMQGIPGELKSARSTRNSDGKDLDGMSDDSLVRMWLFMTCRAVRSNWKCWEEYFWKAFQFLFQYLRKNEETNGI